MKMKETLAIAFITIGLASLISFELKASCLGDCKKQLENCRGHISCDAQYDACAAECLLLNKKNNKL